MKRTGYNNFYVVSNVFMGRGWHVCGTTEEAARNQYLETLHEYGYTESSDQGEVLPEHFRAWPHESWPHHLSFEEAFDWIGQQRKAA